MGDTKWVWDWEEDEDRWRQYENSEELERRYLSGETTMKFSAGNQQYELRFSEMLQINLDTHTARLMRRRPVVQSTPEKLNSSGTPIYWDPNLLPSVGYERIMLETSSPEYSTVLDLFNKTMPGWNIISIERIQNLHLWNFFKIQRDNMKAKAGKDVDERLLFHGTLTQHVGAICRDNIDWRMCGKHGTVYGEGSYFARNAKYADSYARDQGTKSMFVCRVLVGDFTLGKRNDRKPPFKDEQNGVAFDSCVDDMNNPSIFVIFEKSQIYPEYVIQYEQYNEGGVEQPLRTAQAPPPLISTHTQTVQIPPHLISTNGLPAAAFQAPPYLASTNGLPAAAGQAPPYLASSNGLPAAAVQAPFQSYEYIRDPLRRTWPMNRFGQPHQAPHQAAVQAPPPVVYTNAQTVQAPPYLASSNRLPAATVQAPPYLASSNRLPAAAVQAPFQSYDQAPFQSYEYIRDPLRRTWPMNRFGQPHQAPHQAAVQAPPPVVYTNAQTVQAPPYLASSNRLPAAAVQAPFQSYDQAPFQSYGQAPFQSYEYIRDPLRRTWPMNRFGQPHQAPHQAAVQAPPPVVYTNAQTVQAPPYLASTNGLPAATVQAHSPMASNSGLTWPMGLFGQPHQAPHQAPPPVVYTNAQTVQAPPPVVYTNAQTVQAPPYLASTNRLPSGAVQNLSLYQAPFQPY